jgi:hypothetical protein
MVYLPIMATDKFGITYCTYIYIANRVIHIVQDYQHTSVLSLLNITAHVNSTRPNLIASFQYYGYPRWLHMYENDATIRYIGRPKCASIILG